MSKFTEAIAAEPTGRAGGCTTGRLLTKLRGEDRKDFLRLLEEVESGDRTGASVARIVKRTGTEIKSSQILYHVHGDCKCAKDLA